MIDIQTIEELAHGRFGVLDLPCPLCGPERRKPKSEAPMSSSNNTPMSSVIDRDGRCAGFVLRRRGKVEAFTAGEAPIGVFTEVLEAVAAVLEKAEASK